MAEVVSGDLVVLILTLEEAEQLKDVLATAEPESVSRLHDLLESLNVS